MSKPNLSKVLVRGNLQTPQRTSFGLQLDMHQFEELGVDGRQIMLECGIPPIALEEPDHPISRQQEQRILLRLLEVVKLQMPTSTLALENAANVSINLFGLLGLAAMHAESHLEALKTLLAYPELTWGHSLVEGSDSPDYASIEFSLAADEQLGSLAFELRDFCLLRDLASSATLIDEIAAYKLSPSRVQLPFAEPKDKWKFVQHFGCPVDFGMEKARLLYPPGLWEEAPGRANLLIFKGYEKLVSRVVIAYRQQGSTTDLVKHYLRQQVPTPNREAVAELLNISPRTLARRLASENQSFVKLRQQAQLSLAKDYLKHQQLSLQTISHRLGFADNAAFSRAFKSWTGSAPSHWQQE